MAQSKDYEVTLYPVHRKGGFVVTKYDEIRNAPKHPITAVGMDDLIDQIAQIAIEHGTGCRALVRCLGGRKPPGFDKATQNLVFNLGPAQAA